MAVDIQRGFHILMLQAFRDKQNLGAKGDQKPIPDLGEDLKLRAMIQSPKQHVDGIGRKAGIFLAVTRLFVSKISESVQFLEILKHYLASAHDRAIIALVASKANKI